MNELLLSVLVLLAVTANANSDVSAECPKNTDGKLVSMSHEYDCTRFYECRNGKKTLKECPEYTAKKRLYFNSQRQECDWPWNVMCVMVEPDCPENSQGVVNLPHPYKCDMYYECNKGKTLKTCPSGQFFDSKDKRCKPEANADCNLFWDKCPPSTFGLQVQLSHECNCTQYYDCVNGEMLAQNCPLGEEFDVFLRRCIPAEYANCDPSKLPRPINDCKPKGTHYLPHENNCSIYYECKDGMITEKECEGGLSFNELEQMCTWPLCNPTTTTSTSTSTTTTTTTTPSTTTTTSTTTPSTTTSTTTTTTTKPPPIIPPNQCPPAGSNETAKFPHECYCNMYYDCVNGEEIIKTCPAGKLFDYIDRECVVANKVKCKPGQDSDAGVIINSECPREGFALIPHEIDCSFYYSCNDGVKQLRKCGIGHYFNKQISACDIDKENQCHTNTWLYPTVPEMVDEECPKGNGCDCNCIRFPNRNNCSSYWQCKDGDKIQKWCPDGLVFDPIEEICNFPDKVNCTIDVCTKGERKPHECQCQLYYECIGIGWVRRTCEDGQYFDHDKLQCGPADEVNCGSTPKDCEGKCLPGKNHTIPHKDCNKYCDCKNGQGSVVVCHDHMFYHDKKMGCDWPENIKNMTCPPFPCPGNETTVPHECDCDLFYSCENGRLIRKQCASGSEYNYETRICMQPELSHCYKDPKLESDIQSTFCVGYCPKSSNTTVLMPHKDCTKFCKCAYGAEYVVHCSPGLHYSEEEERCINPVLAKCRMAFLYPEAQQTTTAKPSESFWKRILPFSL